MGALAARVPPARALRRRVVRSVAAGAAVLAAVLPASAAHADVVTPPLACVGSGQWLTAGLSEVSTTHQPGDVIDIPRADTVKWAGNVKGYALGAVGPRRPISGSVQLDLPAGSVTIDSWDGTSVRYANEGEHKYNLPKLLVGIKMKLHGTHRESGAVRCSGSVYVRVKGSATSNPLAWAGIGLMVISGGTLLFAGRPVFTKLRAFEDVNPG